MSRVRIAALSLVATLLAGAPALAQESAPPRCALLGQMAVSTWLEMLQALPGGRSEAIDPAVARLDQITGTYAALGCAVEPLGQAMDCLLGSAGDQTDPRALAQSCMADAGLSSD